MNPAISLILLGTTLVVTIIHMVWAWKVIINTDEEATGIFWPLFSFFCSIGFIAWLVSSIG